MHNLPVVVVATKLTSNSNMMIYNYEMEHCLMNIMTR